MDFIHVAVGGGGGLFRIVAVLTRVQVWRIPVPPMMFGVRLLVVVMVPRRFVEKFSERCDVCCCR